MTWRTKTLIEKEVKEALCVDVHVDMCVDLCVDMCTYMTGGGS